LIGLLADYLAGAATGDPDAQGTIRRIFADKVGNNRLREAIELRPIAKEAGDAAFSPRLPSAPVPERITEIAPAPRASASE